MKHYGKVLLLSSLLTCFFAGKTSAVVKNPDNGEVFVHLFEWKWTDIARECEEYLGPKGFGAVQISPPQEHIPNSAWWARYQPISYKLESRSGTRGELVDMVRRCKNAGVKIYADVVINHMSHGQGVGVAESYHAPYSYVDYQREDFHSGCGISSYLDRYQVQFCNLQGLEDLKTEAERVRNRIAAYMNDLLSIGVAGFRIDAAKHIPSDDIKAITSKLSNPNAFIYQEVIGTSSQEPIRPSEYVGNGSVTEFLYGIQLFNTMNGGKLSWLSNFNESWGFLPSSSSIVFVDNHDNQRGHGGKGNIITHKAPAQYAIANILMLAMPYGYPQIMSSYRFEDSDQGPPEEKVYEGGQNNCFGNWVCEHRWHAITNMVEFRKVAAGAPMSNWWDNGNNQIAFSRGNKAFVAINNETATLEKDFLTGLPEGDYCEIIQGEEDKQFSSCIGDTIHVANNGQAHIKIAPNNAMAIHLGSKIR